MFRFWKDELEVVRNGDSHVEERESAEPQVVDDNGGLEVEEELSRGHGIPEADVVQPTAMLAFGASTEDVLSTELPEDEDSQVDAEGVPESEASETDVTDAEVADNFVASDEPTETDPIPLVPPRRRAAERHVGK